ncbi:dihydroneopterin aldolase [Ramlibacter agri]|uniref:dihydroneopterin aldolase n=1 Tax=Ramlibacter agri TaxID=2728837 RepID=UPI00197F3140|nr:dihydroneopterin aldolase [Ramlibacter agri]
MFQALAPGAGERPSATDQEEPLDLVFLEGFRGHTVIGIYAGELDEPQPVEIDLCAGRPRVRACETDRIADTMDYGEIRERLHRLLREHGVQLLEALAEQVARIVIDEFHAHWVRVRVAKPRKFEDTAAVGVVIERRRSLPSLAASRAATLRLIGHGLVPGGR